MKAQKNNLHDLLCFFQSAESIKNYRKDQAIGFSNRLTLKKVFDLVTNNTIPEVFEVVV